VPVLVDRMEIAVFERRPVIAHVTAQRSTRELKGRGECLSFMGKHRRISRVVTVGRSDFPRSERREAAASLDELLCLLCLHRREVIAGRGIQILGIGILERIIQPQTAPDLPGITGKEIKSFAALREVQTVLKTHTSRQLTGVDSEYLARLIV